MTDAGNAVGQNSGVDEQTCLVPYLDPASATGEVKETLASMPFTRNLYKVLGHSSGLYPPVMKIYQSAFNKDKRKLPLLDWQLVVLRVAARLDAPYIWDVNIAVARANGIGQERLDAMASTPEEVQAAQKELWTDKQKALIALVDEQLATYTNTEQTVQALKQFFDTEEIVEAYIMIGAYCLISRITRGLRIDLDPEIPGLEASLKKIIK